MEKFLSDARLFGDSDIVTRYRDVPFDYNTLSNRGGLFLSVSRTMELSHTSSTSSMSALNNSRNKHITIAKKVHDIHRRVKYASRIIKEEGAFIYGGCTNERVGPPAFLGDSDKARWRKEIQDCMKKCVWLYLLPKYVQKSEYYQNKVQTDILDIVTEQNKDRIERGIQIGRDRVDRKWDRREGITSNNNKGSFSESEIGLLKRGEIGLVEGEELEVSHNIQQTEDIYKIIAHLIYGSGRFKKLINRNVWKYIYLNEAREKGKFKPFIGKLNNNTTKAIHSWSMFCAFLRNRDLPISSYELDIIGKLYDVQIKVFNRVDNNFTCVWMSEIKTSREVNVLQLENNSWLALSKKNNSQVSFSLLEQLEQKDTHLEVYNDICNKPTTNIKQLRKISTANINSYFNIATEDIELEVLHQEESKDDSQNIELTYNNTQTTKRGEKQKSPARNNRKRLLWQMWRKKIRDKIRNRQKKEEENRVRENNKQVNKQLVFDFTKEGLTSEEIELLSKGESFCIANHKVDEDRLRTDIYNFGRRLRLHDEFREPKTDSQSSNNRLSVITQTQIPNSNNSITVTSNRLSHITQTQTGIRNSTIMNSNSNRMSRITQTPSTNNNRVSHSSSQRSNIPNTVGKKDKIRKPASLYDPESQNRNLNRYIQCIQEESMLTIRKKVEFKDNITIKQRQALKSLIEKIDKKEIIITKADKGSGLVAVDYDTYIQKGTKYIEEEAKAYIKTNESIKSIIHKLTKARNSVVNKLKESDVIEIETATYCNKQLEERITGLKFYYKIHKDSNIQTMPLRPLQSCINAPTHHLSQVLTDILQPYLSDKYISTYLQDSNQLLYRLERLSPLNIGDTIISSDVAALYPSIPHEEGMQAMTEFLEQNSMYSEEQIVAIVKALELVIRENYVLWNNQIYKQSSGVAMGTPVAVAYANIFMHWIDREIKQQAPFIIQHYRYIDDNLFILPKDKIADLIHIANNILTPQIRFTYEMLDRQTDIGLSFLDTLLFVTQEGKIVSRLYTKKTDKHAYLLPSSYHPLHVTNNIPQAVFNRIRRLCSKDKWYDEDAAQAVEWLGNRGYKQINIKKAAEKSRIKDRITLINSIEDKRDKGSNSQQTEDTYSIPFLVTYSHPTQRIKQVLGQRKGLLDACFTTTKVRPRLTYRRQKNISDIVVQKGLRVPISNNEERILKRCEEKPKYRIVCPCKGKHDQKICRCCAHLKVSIEGFRVKLHKQVDCDTRNIIYMIGCKQCSKRYVGETQQKLKDRLMQHFYNITKLKQPLYIHFNQVHKPENLFITILETVRSSEAAFRKIREAWWINKLQTLEPRGFNVKLECHQVYQANSYTLQIERNRSSKQR